MSYPSEANCLPSSNLVLFHLREGVSGMDYEENRNAYKRALLLELHKLGVSAASRFDHTVVVGNVTYFDGVSLFRVILHTEGLEDGIAIALTDWLYRFEAFGYDFVAECSGLL